MFSFFKSNTTASNALFAQLGADMHSHLLPGIDDGAPDVETSLQLIRSLMEKGYTRLYTTPHIYREYYPNTPETIAAALQVLREALEFSGINIQIDAAAEYFLDEHFEQLLENSNLLTLPEKHVLVEMSFYAPYANLHQTVFSLCTKGYKPILAHPERYLYYANDFEQFEMIRHYGCKLQLNLLSFTGYYGKLSQKLAYKMLENGWVDFLATDVHHMKHIERLGQLSTDSNLLRKLNLHHYKNQDWR